MSTGRSYNPNMLQEEDEEDIYDEIPAARDGTLGRDFARRLHKRLGKGNRRGTNRNSAAVSIV